MVSKAVPVPDHPALEVLGEERVLCVGDLHIGIETDMRFRGIVIPSQTNRMQRELIDLAKGVDRLVIIGDVKHQVPGSTKQEHAEVPRFFNSLLGHYPRIDIVKGNHDTDIERMVPAKVTVHDQGGFVLDDVGFVHGHAWPSQEVMASRLLIMGHNHPAVVFEDGLHHNQVERCWVRCRFRSGGGRYERVPDEAIMVPAFNRSLGGGPVNLEGPRMLGPLLANELVDLANGQVYLMDGLLLGSVSALRVKRRGYFRMED
ncbi:MAG TPA: metallophosphoesterase [Methanomassiliicoccales archaeon]|nr:metallophosphoesterase [Methanomassiliicoccales archaeon]